MPLYINYQQIFLTAFSQSLLLVGTYILGCLIATLIYICDCMCESQHLVHACHTVFQEIRTILKIQLKKSVLPWYWTSSLSIIILSYLLTFVQLTWQVDSG